MANRDLQPGLPAGGGSPMYNAGMSPNTRTVLNQKIRILTPHYGNGGALSQMGVLSDMSPQESRQIESIKGIGFGDIIAELVPSITEATTFDLQRTMLYLCNLWQATGYASGVSGPVRSLRHHKWPFDIEHQMVFSTLADMDLDVANVGFSGGSDENSFTQGVQPVPYAIGEGAQSAIITMFEGVWFNSHSTPHSKDQAAVIETGGVTVTDVHDFGSQYGEGLATGNDPTLGQGGSIRYTRR